MNDKTHGSIFRWVWYLHDAVSGLLDQLLRSQIYAPMKAPQSITSCDFSDYSDQEAIDLIGRSFLLELDYLRHASPTIESDTQDAPLSPETNDGAESPSRQLFGNDYAEVNRTALSLLTLKWILSGDYKSLTCAQESHNRLSKPSFAILRNFFLCWLETSEDVDDLIVAMILSDVGKDPRLKAQVEARSSVHQRPLNHDEVVWRAAELNMFPSLAALSPGRQADIKLGLRCAASVNIPQLLQGECPPASISGTQIMQDKPRAFAMKFLEVILDVAGANAHVDARGANTLTQSLVDGLLVAYEALKGYLAGGTSTRECYILILDHKRAILQRDDLDVASHLGGSAEQLFACLRLLAMGRIESKVDATVYIEAFNQLSHETRSGLVESLNRDGSGKEIAVVAYYMPGLLSLASRRCASITRASKVNVLTSLFRFLGRVMELDTCLMSGIQGIIERDVSFAREFVNDEAFYIEPSVLDSVTVPQINL